MYRSLLAFLLPALLLVTPTWAWGDAPDATQAIRRAIERAIPTLEAGSSGSATERTCFTCHNQALPVIAINAARLRDFTVDEQNLKRQVEHTVQHLERGRKNYQAGKGQGGRVLTAGYALWTLQAGGVKPGPLTHDVAEFLRSYQANLGHWRQGGKRPPTSGSDFTATYVALRGLLSYANDPEADKVKQRVAKAKEWTLRAKPQDTEDQVFRLRSLLLLKPEPKVIREQIDQLLANQRDDGGWSQISDADSDAYATATVLAALLDSGVKVDESPLQKGIGYLLQSQQEDGTWHVTTRADGFQEYYESGFPHGEDQFISISATSWAVYALSLALEPKS